MREILIRNGRFCFYVFIILVVNCHSSWPPSASKIRLRIGSEWPNFIGFLQQNDIFGHSNGKIKIIIWFAPGKECSGRGIKGIHSFGHIEGSLTGRWLFKWATKKFQVSEERHRHSRSSILLSHNSGNKPFQGRHEKSCKFFRRQSRKCMHLSSFKISHFFGQFIKIEQIFVAFLGERKGGRSAGRLVTCVA